MAPLEAGSPLALEIEGEAMPAEGDAEFRPGPPMRFRFDFRDDRYVQTRP